MEASTPRMHCRADGPGWLPPIGAYSCLLGILANLFGTIQQSGCFAHAPFPLGAVHDATLGGSASGHVGPLFVSSLRQLGVSASHALRRGLVVETLAPPVSDPRQLQQSPSSIAASRRRSGARREARATAS